MARKNQKPCYYQRLLLPPTAFCVDEKGRMKRFLAEHESFEAFSEKKFAFQWLHTSSKSRAVEWINSIVLQEHKAEFPSCFTLDVLLSGTGINRVTAMRLSVKSSFLLIKNKTKLYIAALTRVLNHRKAWLAELFVPDDIQPSNKKPGLET